MSEGEHTYNGMREKIIQSLTDSWEPDWHVFAEEAFKGFVKDLHDDVDIMALSWFMNKETGKPEEYKEITLACHIFNVDDPPFFGPKISLSDILFDHAEDQGMEATERLIAASLSAFRKRSESLNDRR